MSEHIHGFGTSFALVVVLFILLIIVGAACCCGGYGGYGYGYC
nr:YjcZ family sporulation protein [Ectobacillus panaciterrae]